MVSNYSINNYNTCNALTDVFPQEVVSHSHTVCQENAQWFFQESIILTMDATSKT